jgi:DNA-damage-inducible protein D
MNKSRTPEGSAEIAAKLFCITQAEEKIQRDALLGKKEANRTHLEVSRKVRQTIEYFWGSMPENLLKPE